MSSILTRANDNGMLVNEIAEVNRKIYKIQAFCEMVFPAAMKYYPISLNVSGRRCVVVGGGRVALRKARSLVEAGALVRVVAKEVAAGFRRVRGIRIVLRNFRARDLDGAFLAIAATDSKTVNLRVAEGARKRGILVNVADDPEMSNFILPAVVRRGDMLLTISTCGVSPAVAKRIRQELERRYGPEYANYLAFLRDFRRQVLSEVHHSATRRRLLRRVARADVAELFGIRAEN